jgi:hypothetical protein
LELATARATASLARPLNSESPPQPDSPCSSALGSKREISRVVPHGQRWLLDNLESRLAQTVRATIFTDFFEMPTPVVAMQCEGRLGNDITQREYFLFGFHFAILVLLCGQISPAGFGVSHRESSLAAKRRKSRKNMK